MNKIVKFTMGILAAFGVTVLVGCTLNKDQIKAISQGAGVASAVTWIAYDNPDTNAIASVKMTLAIIKNDAVNVSSGMTYTVVIYPDIEKFVETSGKVKPQYIPVTLAGSLAALQGIDLLFAMHPEWQTNEDLSLSVVSSFCAGAEVGLSMPSTSKAMQEAKAFSAKRNMVLKGIK